MSTHTIDDHQYEPGYLKKHEFFWRDNRQFLQDHGYALRARYQPNWTPSWKGTRKDWFDCEDGVSYHRGNVLDAQRISDGQFVMLKLVDKDDHPHETAVASFLSSEPIASDSHNHCVPIYEVLQVPEDAKQVILVMPLLRAFDDPRFDTIGEIVEFFHQVFEGLRFMHQHSVAHRDCTYNNIMMDASHLYPESYHPVERQLKRNFSGHARHCTRTQKPVRYYFTDFGLSRRYDPSDGPLSELPTFGGDKTVPEFLKSSEPCDPFPADVYYLGNMIRRHLTEGWEFSDAKSGLDFIKPLVAAMTQEDPSKRPTMDEVVERFNVIKQGLSSWKLRSRVVKQKDTAFFGFFRLIAHWTRRIGFILQRVPAVPVPG